jgi:hypothetical protein
MKMLQNISNVIALCYLGKKKNILKTSCSIHFHCSDQYKRKVITKIVSGRGLGQKKFI